MQLKLIAVDGKSRPTDVADFQTLFRKIQSVPSAKAEPIKLWMAKVASERIDEIQDPEKAIDRGYEYYRRLGYSEAWINERMKGKDARKALTDEWQRTGVSGQRVKSFQANLQISHFFGRIPGRIHRKLAVGGGCFFGLGYQSFRTSPNY